MRDRVEQRAREGGLEIVPDEVPAGKRLQCPDCGKAVEVVEGQECAIKSVKFKDAINHG